MKNNLTDFTANRKQTHESGYQLTWIGCFGTYNKNIKT
jgi:hypothetical protein